MALGFTLGWAVQHPLAWSALLVPIAFAIAAGSDLSVPAAVLGIGLTALAVLGGRALARRRPPDESPDEPSDDSLDEPSDDSADESPTESADESPRNPPEPAPQN